MFKMRRSTVSMKTIFSKQAVTLIVGLNLFLFVFYADTVKQLFDFWSVSYGYSHGILLFPLAMGIYFYELYKKPQLSRAYLNIYSILGLLVLILIWFVADILSIQVIEFFAFFLILFLFNFILTTEHFKNLNQLFSNLNHLWPLLLILFTLPLWDSISEVLRYIETPVVVLALNASFIDAVQDGFLIYIPAGTFLVETSCSGFNQFIVSIPLAALYLYSRDLNLAKGYKFISILLFLAVIFNILRIYIIVVVGHLTHMKSPLIEEHEYLAWIIYGIGIFALFYWWDKKLVNSAEHSKPGRVVKKVTYNIDIMSLRKPVIVLMMTLLIGPIVTFTYANYSDSTLLNVQRLEDELFWKDSSQPTIFAPDYDKGDVVYFRHLANLTGQTVSLYINYFIRQGQGHEAIDGLNRLVREDQGSIIQSQRRLVELSLSEKVSVNESIVRLKKGELFIIWQWYFTNGLHISNSMDARYNNLKTILKNRPQISNIVVSKRVTTTEIQTRKSLRLFLLDNLSVLERSLR